MRAPGLALFCTAALLQPAAAQQWTALHGTVVIQTRIPFSDSLRKSSPMMAMLPDTMHVTFTLTGDGTRYGGAATMDVAMLQGGAFRLAYRVGDDSLHAGVLVPPMMTGMVNGAPGMKFDLPLHGMDSTIRHRFDSLMNGVSDSATSRAEVSYRDLGEQRTVAGMSCEEWSVITKVDTTEVCVIPAPAALAPFLQHFRSLALARATATGHSVPEAFGGKDVVPIRVDAPHGTVVELMKYSPETDTTLFTLPPGLVAPPAGMPFKLPGTGGGKSP